jgi:hypothetical protein
MFSAVAGDCWPLCAAGSKKPFHSDTAAVRGGQQETVPSGFLHLPSGRRYALHP